MLFVELCAGSAAVSMAWLAGVKPPLGYQGSKRAFAQEILTAFGMRKADTEDRVLLVEAGPWGEAWEHWTTGGLTDTVARLREWLSSDPRTLWNSIHNSPVPTTRPERVAAWCVLQLWVVGKQLKKHRDGAWVRGGGFDRTSAYAAEYHAEYLARGGNPKRYPSKGYTLNGLVDMLEHMPDLSRVSAIYGDVRSVSPIPGAVVYLDPPYAKTAGYGHHQLSREDVYEVASKWAAAGCLVGVSEAEPLMLDWPCHQKLLPPKGRRRNNFTTSQDEWLSLSDCPDSRRAPR